mmetsp:Transcript_29512/g.76176  ORF Transcript_29512/g.76176 Transcript_29512/m.76176 type:complete len:238 (-) Transcript_29512:401-1114(-)
MWNTRFISRLKILRQTVQVNDSPEISSDADATISPSSVCPAGGSPLSPTIAASEDASSLMTAQTSGAIAGTASGRLASAGAPMVSVCGLERSSSGEALAVASPLANPMALGAALGAGVPAPIIDAPSACAISGEIPAAAAAAATARACSDASNALADGASRGAGATGAGGAGSALAAGSSCGAIAAGSTGGSVGASDSFSSGPEAPPSCCCARPWGAGGGGIHASGASSWRALLAAG